MPWGLLHRILLLTSVIVVVHATDSSSTLVCQDQGDQIECRFRLPRQNHNRLVEYCAEDGFCIEGQLMASKKAAPSSTAMIVVGDYSYEEPLQQYGRDLYKLLRRYRHRWVTPYEEADWYVELGLTHMSLYDEGLDEEDVEGSEEEEDAHIMRAIAALSHAVRLYQRIEETAPEDVAVANFVLASVKGHLGEAYGQAHRLPNYLSLSLGTLAQAEQAYRQVIGESSALDESTRFSAQLGWAQCCSRIGVQLLEPHYTAQDSTIADYLLNVDMDEVLGSQPEVRALFGNREEADMVFGPETRRQLAHAIKAQYYFGLAKEVYRKALASNDNDPDERVHFQRDLSTVLHNEATAAAHRMDSATAVKSGEEALELYREILKDYMHRGAAEALELIVAMADLTYNLADYNLQLGDYETAKKRYRESMDLHQRHGIPSQRLTGQQLTVMEEKELEKYERALEEYGALVMGATDIMVPEEVSVLDEESGEVVFERNEAYEADLHANMGALSLAADDIVQARSHLTQAIQLYEMSGERHEEPMAYAKYVYAQVLFRSADFQESAKFHDEALDTYHEALGDDSSPLKGASFVDWDGFLEKVNQMNTVKVPNNGELQPGDASRRARPDPVVDLESHMEALLNQSLTLDLS